MIDYAYVIANKKDETFMTIQMSNRKVFPFFNQKHIGKQFLGIFYVSDDDGPFKGCVLRKVLLSDVRENVDRMFKEKSITHVMMNRDEFNQEEWDAI